MPRIDTREIKNARLILKQEKVFTLNELVSVLKCSSRTAQTRLKEWKTHTSYNQNGRYYTMPEIPQFDVNGLWRYSDKYFSRHGNLKSTIIHLIQNSRSGLTGEQIGKLVGLLPRSFLHHFCGTPGIQRAKRDGVYVYFSGDPETYEQQTRNRLNVETQITQPLTDAEMVVILTALIKHYDVSLKEIMALPAIKATKLSSSVIEKFLDSHGLLKKTLVTRP